MAQWLKFEEQCTNYLNHKFGGYARFIHLGGEDSTVPDIRVTTGSGNMFYMDAKYAPAQCSQFVLLPNVAGCCFVFSERNKTILTPEVQKIIDHMNADFDSYKEAGTAGKDIDLGDGGKVFYKWIMATYKAKGAEFFITNDYTILPIVDFERHFDVSASYRVKRSGSAAVGVRNAPLVIQFLKNTNYPIEKFCTENGKLFVFSKSNLHEKRFVFGEFEHMFSARGDRYEIRRLSNTFNANVIFSISKKAASGLTDSEFIKALL